MVKGCQRETVTVDHLESKIFERAWFLLRPSLPPPSLESMMTEAKRLIEGTAVRRKKFGKSRLFPFFCGVFLGAFCSFGIFLLLHMRGVL